MEDEIEIEEHDVLDNPLIKSMFPDISTLKKEITDIVTVPTLGTQPVIERHTPFPAYTNCHQFEKSPVDKDSIKVVNKNKIIIGTKPIKNQIEINRKKNDIISEQNDMEYYEKHVKPYNAKVMLNNIAFSLYQSSMFCQECKILFSTCNNFEKHKKEIHSFEHTMKMDIGRVFDESTNAAENGAISCSNISKQNRLRESGYNIQSYCRHCRKNFSSQSLLIDHIYEVLQTEPKKCEICKAEFICQDDLTKHKKQVHNVATKYNISMTERKSKAKQPCDSKRYLYRCHICSTYFYTKEFCSIHLYKKHGLNVNDFKLHLFDPLCKFCPYRGRSKYIYNTHIQRRHNERLHFNAQVKNATKKLKDIKQNRQCDKWKNKIEQLHASNVKKSPRPYAKEKRRNIQLEDTNKLNILRRKNIIKECSVQLSTNINLLHIKKHTLDNVKPILGSVLYKCTRCDIHFLFSIDALRHAEHMELLINWKCSICHRIFKKEDDTLHMKQHLHSRIFKVYDVNETVASKILYKCSKCAVHYSETEYLRHYPVCEEQKPESSFCDVCVMLIDNNLKISHKKCHTDKEYQFSDFIIIQTDVISNNNLAEANDLPAKPLTKPLSDRPNCASKMNPKDQPKIVFHGSNKKKLAKKKITSFFCCNYCKCFLNTIFINDKKISVHLNGRCAQIEKNVCKICGLLLTKTSLRSHIKHHKQFAVRLQDLNFCDLKTKRKVCPPAPSYFECKICAVHFISREAKARHICSDIINDYLTCPNCQMKLSEAAFKLHVPFHMYTLNGKLSEENNVQHSETSEVSMAISELKPNQSNCTGSNGLVDIRNILYKCLSCYITVDTYDKVVEHCQKHYSQNDREISTVICKNCNLTFEESIYSCHEKLHIKNNANFIVLIYDIFYFRFNNDVWKKHLFKNVSANQIQKILADSMYKFEARIKLDVIQNGKSDLTVFKCDKCQCYVDYPSLFSHADNSCFKLRPHPCTLCGLNFISSVSRTHHEKIHKKQSITSKSYRIILFNQEKDYDYNKSMSSCNYDLLYQCRNCNVAGSKALLKFHECSAVDLKECPECGLLFSIDEFKMHMEKHSELESFNYKIIKVVLVGIKNNGEGTKSVSTFKGTVYDYTYFECSECNTCFKREQLKLEHICSFGSSQSACPKCNLYFSTNSVKHHIKLHNSYPDFTRENIRLVKYIKPAMVSSNLNNTVSDDGVIIMKSSSMDDDDHIVVEETVCLNDDSSTASVYNEDSYNIETDEEKSVSIFKCACGLHFINSENIEAHRKTCNKARISKQNCSKCGLLFTPKELFDHLVKHHSNKNMFTYTIVT